MILLVCCQNGLKVEKKKKSFVPPPRLFSVGEARCFFIPLLSSDSSYLFILAPIFSNSNEHREMNIPVERRRHRDSGEYFEVVDGLTFEDGFLRKTVSIKAISTHNVQPSLDELEKFRRVGDDINEDVASLSTLFSNRKKGHFMKGDAVVVVKGDLKNLEGCVEKVEDATVHIRPKQSGLPVITCNELLCCYQLDNIVETSLCDMQKTLAFNATDLCKHFNPGDHVKVVSGAQQGATGMVVKVEGHVLIILSDTTKEHVRNFWYIYACF
jgi:transcription elongation factor SPT5